MSENEYQELVERVLHNVANPMISTDVGIELKQKDGFL
jgi:hypothetical protein